MRYAKVAPAKYAKSLGQSPGPRRLGSGSIIYIHLQQPCALLANTSKSRKKKNISGYIN